MTYKIDELNQERVRLYKEYCEAVQVYEDVYMDAYRSDLAAATTLEERWEIYSIANSMEFETIDEDDERLVLKATVTLEDAMEQKFQETFEVSLMDLLDTDDYDTYYTKLDLINFFETNVESLYAEDYSKIFKRSVKINITPDMINQWKNLLIDNAVRGIRIERRYW